ncbi:MAG: hypothetical protein WCI27_05255 [Candidatus Omnitrophota bacterium]
MLRFLKRMTEKYFSSAWIPITVAVLSPIVLIIFGLMIYPFLEQISFGNQSIYFFMRYCFDRAGAVYPWIIVGLFVGIPVAGIVQFKNGLRFQSRVNLLTGGLIVFAILVINIYSCRTLQGRIRTINMEKSELIKEIEYFKYKEGVYPKRLSDVAMYIESNFIYKSINGGKAYQLE